MSACALLIAAPAVAHAGIDLSCSSTTATSAIAGTVKNGKDQLLSGMRVELSVPNTTGPTSDFANTDANGHYRICAGQNSGSGHNVYDVHVRDLSSAPLYATANQPYSTYTNFAGSADFTNDSGVPLLYTTNLTITPNHITTLSGATTVIWTARSKAPSVTTFLLTLGHLSDTLVPMAPAGTEGGGPSVPGGWNLWRYSAIIPQGSTEALWWSGIHGYEGGFETTQSDRQPYVIDNQGPLFGPAGASTTECGPGVVANTFSPASPKGTTNQLPIVIHGVCDHWSNGARSGLDPFSLTGEICLDAALTIGCYVIHPVLNAQNIVWYPSSPMAYGTYYFRWHIADYAGNVADNPRGFELIVARQGGQTPSLGAVQPGQVGQAGTGTALGVIVGSSLTSPNSYPQIGLRATDADGQTDMVPGTMHVRVYYQDNENVVVASAPGAAVGLVYDYDPFKGPNEYDALTKKGGGTFDLSNGTFRASGYPLQARPPGRYIASASITDYGGNTAFITWQWLLAAAV